MEDFLEPNKKYFYTFRAVDVHGKVSNPSQVYQLEISFDGASAFLLTKIINLILAFFVELRGNYIKIVAKIYQHLP